MSEDPPTLLPLHDPASSKPPIATMLEDILKDIPCGDEAGFPESGFFTRQDPLKPAISLPTPAAVREEGARQNGHRAKQLSRPPPARYPSLGLIVKYGADVSVAEAQCILLVRKHLPSIPTPEVYGWQRDGHQTFIFMELVDGCTVEELWDDLTEQDLAAICAELHGYVALWRGLSQEVVYGDHAPFIGNVVNQPLLDCIFAAAVGAGPFGSVSEFHDYYTTAYGPNRLGTCPLRSPHPYRKYLPDDVPIVFTHADLHPSNIIVTRGASGIARVAAIIDWQQSGWYPAYWEYCKSRWAWSYKVGMAWKDEVLPAILDVGPYEGDCYDYWDHFVCARGM